MTESEYLAMLARVSRFMPQEDPGVAKTLKPDIEALRKCAALGFQPSTDEANLNKTEAAYLAWLRTLDDYWIGIQCWTFKLGHDCRYTPDFCALDGQGLRVIDVKGTKTDGSNKPYVEEDSMLKMRFMPRMFPMIRVLIAFKVGEVWEHIEIKP